MGDNNIQIILGRTILHLHCQNCFSVHCTFKNSDFLSDGCEIEQCSHGCGAVFHSCKKAEHRQLCSKEKINCINFGYGCPMLMRRSELGQHLEVCPASAVTCTMEWTRGIASKQQLKHTYLNSNSNLLDVALALRDERILNYEKNQLLYSKHIDYHSTNSTASHSEELISNCNLSGQTKNLTSPISKPLILPSSLTLDNSIVLNLGIEAGSIDCHPTLQNSLYKFRCGQTFRRDEFSWHFKNTHDDIHSGLNGWMQYRCPLALYGCQFSICRIQPCHSTIVHSSLLESFGAKPKTISSSVPYCDLSIPTRSDTSDITPLMRNADLSISDKNNYHDDHVEFQTSQNAFEGADRLSCLPFELLQYIAKFLDSFSLLNLSLTCYYLRDVCHSLLQSRGIVLQEWQRTSQDQGKWHVSHQKWLFSTAFTPIRQWMLEDSSIMLKHLKICPYFELANICQDPIQLPGMTSSSDIEDITASINSRMIRQPDCSMF